MGDSYPGGTGVLSYQQIENLWTNNGGDPRWAPLMAAIAEAESSGHPGVLNDTPTTGDYSVGLWQINFYGGNAGRATQGVYGGGPGMGYQAVAAKLANDPNQQAKAAVSLFANGAGAGNWAGDAAWKSWHANGAPAYPTQAQIASWGAATSSGAGTPYTGGAGAGGTQSGGSPNLPPGLGFDVPHIGHVTLVTGQQEIEIKGWFLMISGAVVAAVGLAVVLASIGLESKAGQLVNAVPGGRAVKAASAGQATRRTEAVRHEQRVQLVQERGSQRRATEALGPRSAGELPRVSSTEQRRNRERLARRQRELSPEGRRQAATF